jgi:hypothetical protein
LVAGTDRKVIEAAPDVAQPDHPIGVQYRTHFEALSSEPLEWLALL